MLGLGLKLKYTYFNRFFEAGPSLMHDLGRGEGTGREGGGGGRKTWEMSVQAKNKKGGRYRSSNLRVPRVTTAVKRRRCILQRPKYSIGHILTVSEDCCILYHAVR